MNPTTALYYSDLHREKYFDELPQTVQQGLERVKPHYKQMWLDKCHDQKIILWGCIITVLISLLCLAGSITRNSALVAKNDELYQKQDIGLKMAVQYDQIVTQLQTENQQLKDELQLTRLTPTAKKHMKQQPKVTEKIKTRFGTSWVEAIQLYSNEASLDPLKVNKSSGACGLVQALPCSKLTDKCDLNDLDCQLAWGEDYIIRRYGTVQAALNSNIMRGWY